MTKSESRKRVLFLCTENSARSQIAEVLLRTLSRGDMVTFSAGAAPAEALDRATLRLLRRHGLPVEGLTPKDLSTFAGQAFDYAITLCDRLNEKCIELPGTDSIRWSFPDPARTEEGPTRESAYEDYFQALNRRLRLLILIADKAGLAS
jgi:ArsR family transcriptional regulator, arsenate/arsenite/antimonite-responsive transcriptional repressor / arsenate reductase (thioredoxin)